MTKIPETWGGVASPGEELLLASTGMRKSVLQAVHLTYSPQHHKLPKGAWNLQGLKTLSMDATLLTAHKQV